MIHKKVVIRRSAGLISLTIFILRERGFSIIFEVYNAELPTVYPTTVQCLPFLPTPASRSC